MDSSLVLNFQRQLPYSIRRTSSLNVCETWETSLMGGMKVVMWRQAFLLRLMTPAPSHWISVSPTLKCAFNNWQLCSLGLLVSSDKKHKKRISVVHATENLASDAAGSRAQISWLQVWLNPAPPKSHQTSMALLPLLSLALASFLVSTSRPLAAPGLPLVVARWLQLLQTLLHSASSSKGKGPPFLLAFPGKVSLFSLDHALTH